MSEALCPIYRDGRHRRKVWQDKQAGTSGFVCVGCSKTWHHTDEGVMETYQLMGWERAEN